MERDIHPVHPARGQAGPHRIPQGWHCLLHNRSSIVLLTPILYET